MSISDEIIRIKNAKENLKVSLQKRGTEISGDVLIHDYYSVLDSAPYAVKGTFTPEADTKVFSINGLPFAPAAVYIVCNELHNLKVDNATVFCVQGKGYRGARIGYFENDPGLSASFISENSGLTKWLDDGYEIDFSQSGSSMQYSVFKAGYTYTYFISGGFGE